MAGTARENPADRARIGSRLRNLRLRAHLSMRELARRAGIVVSNVSNLEAGRVTTTLATLRKLLVALGTDIGPFFADNLPDPPGYVFRRHQIRSAADAGRCLTFVLPDRPDIRMVMMDEEFYAGEKPMFESLAGDLGGYVIRGELRLEMKGKPTQILQPGDSFYIPAGWPARGRCAGGESVRLITAQIREPGQSRRAEGPRRRRKTP
jgi:transcriptional regulator with XRE-family HTH domain